ncbi:hypothetical protein AC579_322 [Pseudocercospora musae]|uniref:Glycosyl hydrolase family 30 TIM-barrel domain-containing protein n=1 Tax=Pseudocercospora musae TaxID=113226 RepID=A0A139IR31_9PEZI|nr:hypothetical protein AC579_322 [Pseudocercospora musae]
MIAIHVITLAIIISQSAAQSIAGFGSSGGSKSGTSIGDIDNPVLQAEAYVTDARIPNPHKTNDTRRLSGTRPPRLAKGNPDGSTCVPRSVLIDDLHGAKQEMMGFGMSWTDCTVENLNKLQPGSFHNAMKELFAPHPIGNDMGMMRHTIGSSDMSGRQYSFCDNGPSFNEGEPDLNLETFALGEDGEAMVNMIKIMGEYKGNVFLIGSPWSYPGWMKHNGLAVAQRLNTGTSYNNLNNSFDRQYTKQAVAYFTKYLDAYKACGVQVNAITLMNEPLNYQGGYPCMFLDAADAADILNAGLGAALQERNVSLLAYDHNTDQAAYPMRVIQRAPGFVHGAAWHCYAYLANYTVLEDFHEAFPNTPQFLTECSNYRPRAGALNWAVADAFMLPTQFGSSGSTMWVMATDANYGPHAPWGGCDACSGAIIVNSSTAYTKTSDYYMVGQFSRFVRRGARNYKVLRGIEGDISTNGQFGIVAINNPDKGWVIVFKNNMNRTETVRLSFTGSSHVWEGTIDNATVTTWLIPSDKVLETSGRNAPSSMHFPFFLDKNVTTNTTCPSPTTAAPTSTSTSTETPRLPVPNTTHSIPQNDLANQKPTSLPTCPCTVSH